MNLSIQKSTIAEYSEVRITGSKSESNRLLLLQALFPKVKIENLSNSDDSELMQAALKSNSEIIDIHHAGTAMRFLTGYFAIQNNRTTILTGSQRMQERPIKVLVDALTSIGADIDYIDNEGYPPLKINGKSKIKSEVSISANVSSQYISALMLIASKLEDGLVINLKGKITSRPYLEMTLSLLDKIGVETEFLGNTITIKSNVKEISETTLVVESDWSSASYFYSIVALSEIDTKIKLSSYKNSSLQGDSVLSKIYEDFGVETTFINNSILLKKTNRALPSKIEIQLNEAPDIAQTIAITCLGLGISCHLTGLHTLKIKETDRLSALKIEIEKLDTPVEITEKTLTISGINTIKSDVLIDTYQDHRMAMAFAPLALKTSIEICDAEVVSKSYPDFWKDLKSIGFQISK